MKEFDPGNVLVGAIVQRSGYSVKASPWSDDSDSAGTPESRCNPSAFCMMT